ncbi:MAG: tyrosine-type recombinase/integrase [Planctomycetia bacterium]|nr:tyrosine-type recombinase/integrase [Planctomycetia bacterium]
MASLYKKPVIVNDTKSGKKTKTKSRKWWGRFRDENGVEKRVPLASDKAAARTMLNEHVLRVERRVAGLESPFEGHQRRRLAEHLDDYRKYLRDKGGTEAHVVKTEQRVRSVVDGCKFDRINDISASGVQSYLAQLRSDGKGAANSNHYLGAIKSFSRWLVRDRRTSDDRLAHLAKMNEATDRRRVRRPLSEEEFARLLDAAANGPMIQHVAGRDREILYIIACYTGFRRNEIGSVTMRSFDFQSDPPTMTVEAGYSKRRRRDVIPLRRELAVRIEAWITEKANAKDSAPLFTVANKRTAEMIR